MNARIIGAVVLCLGGVLGGCGGGSDPVVNTYPLNGTFRQVSIGGNACPGSASSSTGVSVSCGADYRIEFDSVARTFRFFDNAAPATSISQGDYSVQGNQLTLEIAEPGSILIQKNAFTFTDPNLNIVYTYTGSGNVSMAFQRL